MHSSLTRAYPVQATCEIDLGSMCEVVGLSHNDAFSYRDNRALNGQKAVVVKLNEGSVDIKMETGPRKGKIVEGFDPGYLFFSGTFRKAVLVEEETHF